MYGCMHVWMYVCCVCVGMFVRLQIIVDDTALLDCIQELFGGVSVDCMCLCTCIYLHYMVVCMYGCMYVCVCLCGNMLWVFR
jgi:hypothetical protein